MDSPDHDPSPTLDWTLQDLQVSDAALASTLVETYAGEVYQLAHLLLEDAGAARLAVAETVARAVERRASFWGDVPLRLWLLTNAVQTCRAKLGLRGLFLRVPTLFSPTGRAWSFLSGAGFATDELLLTLRYQSGFSTGEIAYINTGRMVEDDVENTVLRLRQARRRRNPAWDELESQAAEQSSSRSHVHALVLARSDGNLYPGAQAHIERHLGGCEACRTFSAQVAEAEARLGLVQPEGPNHKTLSGEDLESLAEQAALQVNRRRRRQKTGLVLRQAIFGLVILVFLGFSIRFAGTGGQESDSSTPTKQRTPVKMPTPTQAGLAARRVDNLTYQYYVQEGETLNSIAERTGVPAETIRELNFFSESYGLLPGREIKVPFSRSLFMHIAKQKVDPAPLLPPLNLESSKQDILERIRSSSRYWQTLWRDVHQLSYGQPGYVGPPTYNTRIQVWSRHPELNSVIYSFLYPQIVGEGRVIYAHRVGDLFFTKSPEENTIISQPVGELEDQWFESQFLFLWLGEDYLRQLETSSFHVVRMDTWLGRPVLVIQDNSEAGSLIIQMWVDASLGLLLRMQGFSETNLDWPVMEEAVLNLAIDQPIPLEIFDPMVNQPQGFAADYTGRERDRRRPAEWSSQLIQRPALPVTRIPPPANLDLSTARVYLDWPGPDQQAGGENSQPAVSIYADEYYLGDLTFFDADAANNRRPPQSLIFGNCSRSPDGRLVTILLSPNFNNFLSWDNQMIFWVRLDRPLEAKRINNAVNGIAISPDSNQIAFWRSKAGSPGEIHLINVRSEEEKVISIQGKQRPDSADNLVWSPDGKYIAIMMHDWDVTKSTFIVLDIKTGEQVYSEPYIWGEDLSADAPVHAWGIPFPDGRAWAKGCLLP